MIVAPTDPMEAKIYAALRGANIDFTHDPRETSGLDFRLTATPVHIEVKQMHSPRIAEQMSRVENVIAAQGPRAVAWLAALIDDSAPETPVIDLAYSQINALGGTVTGDDLHGKGYCQAIDDALTILTKLGAKDAPYAALSFKVEVGPSVDRLAALISSDEEEGRLTRRGRHSDAGGFP